MPSSDPLTPNPGQEPVQVQSCRLVKCRLLPEEGGDVGYGLEELGSDPAGPRLLALLGVACWTAGTSPIRKRAVEWMHNGKLTTMEGVAVSISTKRRVFE